MRLSCASSTVSRRMKRRSKRERSESGSPMFSVVLRVLSYDPYTGFAAATTLQRALREVWMPALAIVTVCCSITSWIATRSWSDILSNSSMHTIPLSARTMAPASSLRSPVSESCVTAAVSPTPDDPRPVVDTASGAMFMMYRISCDFATEGSPTMRRLMSPRMCVPLCRFFSCPPRSCRSRPRLTHSCPQIEGASDRAIASKTSFRFAMALMLSMSVVVIAVCSSSFARDRTATPMTTVRNMPEVPPSPVPVSGL
mmetsp:Transcript_22966/g.54897  ORF Transcript_22966/g.54897 Transcript_22966/m.54897 type:complete len:256 (+) Transcript_22966:1078-1845(+)